jgi:hypothetical protein
MKKKLLLFTFLICSFNFDSYGQINPVENLTWSHWYEFPHNFFELSWDEPAQPHDEILGYNIYRNNELYRFQTERTVYNFWTQIQGIVSNCGNEQFLAQDNQGQPYTAGIDLHVTAVYNPGQIESGYLQTYFDGGLLLPTTDFTQKKAILFPNPTNGILNIEIENLKKILVYDISGKLISEFAPNAQIDLSNLSKGLYLIKLFSNAGIIVDKIVIK